MKILVFVIFAAFSVTLSPWLKEFGEAKRNPWQQHQVILLNFSGSNRSGPYVRMSNEICGMEAFTILANHQLVLVNVDFPRQKKNQVTREQQQLNVKLADR